MLLIAAWAFRTYSVLLQFRNRAIIYLAPHASPFRFAPPPKKLCTNGQYRHTRPAWLNLMGKRVSYLCCAHR
jgi:hypothetical protein